MTDYLSTVHVPVTSFPMRGDLLNRQEEILARLQAQDLYRAILEDRRDAEPFIIHDGPPYASGQVHVGIDLNKNLKDVVAKCSDASLPSPRRKRRSIACMRGGRSWRGKRPQIKKNAEAGREIRPRVTR